MEILEIIFNPFAQVIVIFILGLGFLASPYEVEYDEADDMFI